MAKNASTSGFEIRSQVNELTYMSLNGPLLLTFV